LTRLFVILQMDFSSQLASLQKTAASAGAARRAHGGRASQQHQQFQEEHQQAKRPRHRRHHYFNEHAMKKALATLPHYRPSSRHAIPNTKTTTNLHIALLFITIDDLPFEHIWKEWIDDNNHNAGENTHNHNTIVSVVCHAKFPERVKSEWLKQHLLVQPPKLARGNAYEPVQYHSRRPEWGSIEITRAMLDLLHEGLLIGQHEKKEDPRFPPERYGHDVPVTHFIFCSETCLPVTTLTEVGTALQSSSSSSSSTSQSSWVNARNTPNNGYSRQQQFDKVDPVVPKTCVYKADQWMVLTREHGAAVLKLDRHLPRGACLWQCFDETNASDELYFPTALALLGLLRAAPSPASQQIERRRVTYCDWSVSARNPATFFKGMEDLKRIAIIARNEKCLFARKFIPFEVTPGDSTGTTAEQNESPGQITVEEWKECIHALAEESTAKQSTEKRETEPAAKQSTETSETDTKVISN
jgi:hypothetical protein